jgi:hypothetical protein
VNEISTRIWLDERLWDGIRKRAETEGITIRELIPRLVGEVLSEPSPRKEQTASTSPAQTHPAESPLAESGPPIVALSDVYQCGVCGAQIRLGGLSNHLGRHQKEQQAMDAERS